MRKFNKEIIISWARIVLSILNSDIQNNAVEVFIEYLNLILHLFEILKIYLINFYYNALEQLNM